MRQPVRLTGLLRHSGYSQAFNQHLNHLSPVTLPHSFFVCSVVYVCYLLHSLCVYFIVRFFFSMFYFMSFVSSFESFVSFFLFSCFSPLITSLIWLTLYSLCCLIISSLPSFFPILFWLHDFLIFFFFSLCFLAFSRLAFVYLFGSAVYVAFRGHTHTLGPLFHLCALSRGERALYNEKFTAVWWPLVSCKHIVQPRVKLGMEVKPFCRLTNIRLISISTSEIQTFTINFIVVWCVFNGHCSAEGQIKELRNTFQ